MRSRLSHVPSRLLRGVMLPVLLLVAMSPPAVAAASACSTTTTSTYTVSVCLTPSSGTISGTATVTATVTVSNTTTRVSGTTFCLDGTRTTTPTCDNGGPGYLLHDFHYQSSPSQTQTIWKFSLPSAHWIDGNHTLLAVANMRDGTTTQPVTATVNFSNGNSTQPVNNANPTISTGTSSGANPLVVAAVGDAAAGESKTTSVASRIKGWKPNLFLYLGDVYQDGSYTELTDWYGSVFGSLRSVTDPVIGNHEYLTASDPATSSKVVPAGIAYFDYWNNLPDYYSFNAGGWHFVALNSNQNSMTNTKWQAQLSWLQSDMTANASACTIVYFHHPAFNIGSEPIPGSSTTLWSMVAGHATLVLNGHDHTYQRWKAMNASGTVTSAGTTEVIVGTGGHAIGAFKTTDSRVAKSSATAGALKLSLGATSAGLQFISSSGSVIDSATVPCI